MIAFVIGVLGILLLIVGMFWFIYTMCNKNISDFIKTIGLTFCILIVLYGSMALIAMGLDSMGVHLQK